MDQGDCFFNKSTPRLPSHPWVIVSYPSDDPENVLIVNLTDANSHHDRSCLLGPDDHPGVFTKPSCVNYRDAQLTSIADLNKALSMGLLFPKPSLPTKTLDKIIDGAVETEELINAHRKLLRDQGIIP